MKLLNVMTELWHKSKLVGCLVGCGSEFEALVAVFFWQEITKTLISEVLLWQENTKTLYISEVLLWQENTKTLSSVIFWQENTKTLSSVIFWQENTKTLSSVIFCQENTKTKQQLLAIQAGENAEKSTSTSSPSRAPAKIEKRKLKILSEWSIVF